MRKRIYIAGPMRGYDELNMPAFKRADFKLCHLDWNVENPVFIGDGFGTPAEIEANPDLLRRLMELELAVVKSCDAIYLLRGWEKSTGARAELRVALDHNLEIILERE